MSATVDVNLLAGRDFHHVTTPAGLAAAIADLEASFEIAVDTETAFPRAAERREHYNNIYNLTKQGELAPFDPHTAEVRLVQMKGEQTQPYVVDLWAFTDTELAPFKNFLSEYPGTWILMNAKFDLKMLFGSLGVWLDETAQVFDVMQASILLGNSVGLGKERGHKLYELSRDFLGINLDKTEQASDWSVAGLTDEQLEYAALDVAHLHELKDVLEQGLLSLGQAEPMKLDMDVIGPTARMEWNGVPINLDVYKKVQEAARYEMPALLGRIGHYFREEVGQTVTTVYVEIERPDGTVEHKPYKLPWGNAKGGGKAGKSFLMAKSSMVLSMLKEMGLEMEDGKELDNVQRATLQAFRETHPGVGMLIDYWQLVKQAEFDYKSYYHPATGCLHPKFNAGGASTGRFSCTRPNLQQVPGKLTLKHPDGQKYNYRHCFEGPQGWLLNSADFSGQELAVMAALSGDPVMIKTLNENGDLHSEAAAGLFGIDPKDARQIKPGDPLGRTYRDYGKICVAAGTLVSTDHGLLPIEAVRPGMRAYTDLGSELISAHIDNGVRETLILGLDGGYQIECTPDHQLRVIDANGDYVWKEAQDIIETDFVALKPEAQAEGPAVLPAVFVDQTKVTSHKVVELPTRWTPELARFLGYYVSEGSSSHTGTGYEVDYAQAVGPLADDMIAVATSIWGDVVKVTRDYQPVSYWQPQHLVSFDRRDIYNWVSAIGCGQGAASKRVPWIVFQAPLWAQREFLRAMFAGDGCITNNGANSVAVTYNSKSKALVLEVQQLMLNLGCLASILPTKCKKYPEETYWCLRALDPASFLEVIGIVHKEDAFSWYERFADNTVIPNQEARIRKLQPQLRGKLDQIRFISGRPYNRTHKEKLYECIRKTAPVKLNYTRLAMVTSEKHLAGQPEFDYLADLEQRKLAFRQVVMVVPSEARVYDITVENQHCFLANGVVAHNCMFSLAYGKTASGFAKDWKITEDEAKLLISGFEERFYVLTTWLKRHGEIAKMQNYLALPNGAMRFMGGEGANDAAKTRMGSNYLIQGMSSWMTRIAMISLDRQITVDRLPIKMIGCIHDELLSMFQHSVECPSAILYSHEDVSTEQLKIALAAAKAEKDKPAEKQIEAALAERQAAVHGMCLEGCPGQDCAHRYENLIGTHMKAAGDSILKEVVPAGFSVATARYWSH